MDTVIAQSVVSKGGLESQFSANSVPLYLISNVLKMQQMCVPFH